VVTYFSLIEAHYTISKQVNAAEVLLKGVSAEVSHCGEWLSGISDNICYVVALFAEGYPDN